MTDGFFSCGVSPIGVGPKLFDQIVTVNKRVDDTLATTLELAGELASYNIANVSFNVDPTAVQSYGIYVTEAPDAFNEVKFGDLPDMPPALPAANITGVAAPGTPPPAPPGAPPPTIPGLPDLYTPTFGVTPVPVFGSLPTYADLTSGIPFPSPLPITIPPAPTVNFGIPFTGTKPVFMGTAPDAADFNYTEQAYSPLLVDEIKATIQAMLAGTTGLPKVVEDALWAREAEREAEKAAAATQDAFDEMNQRGFTIPTGPLASKLMQVRQNSQNQANDLGRAVMIRVHEVLVDQLKFGVQQGLALEDTWIKLYSDVQGRRLQAAQVAVNISISVYNALVAQYQAQGQVFQAEAAVYASLIQAELAKLQAYAEEIRGQQLISQINLQEIEAYKARLSAIETNVRVYLAELQGYESVANTEKTKLEAFRITIEIEDEKLKASAQQLAAWSGQIQGEGLIQQAYQTRTQAYLGEIQGWKTGYEAQIDYQRSQIAKLEADTARYIAQVGGITAQANYQTAVGQAMVADNATKIQKYTAGAQWTSSYNSALAEKIKMLNDANAQNTQLALKNGEINAQNGLAVAQSLQHAIEVATQVLAQMTASFAGNVNLSGSASDSTSFSQSCAYQTVQSYDH